MWLLLMIMFSNPYHIENIKILGNYDTKAICATEVKRAVAIKVNRKLSFGCIKIENHKMVNVMPKIKL